MLPLNTRVAFMLPDGVERVGEVARCQADGDVVVSVDTGAYYLLPPDQVRAITARTDIYERRDAAQQGSLQVLTLGYKDSTPSEEELTAWARVHFPGNRVVEASNGRPGWLRIKLVAEVPGLDMSPGIMGEEQAGSGAGFDVEGEEEGAAVEPPPEDDLDLSEEVFQLSEALEDLQVRVEDLEAHEEGEGHYDEVDDMSSHLTENGPHHESLGTLSASRRKATIADLDWVRLLWQAFGTKSLPQTRLRAAAELRRRLHGADDKTALVLDEALDIVESLSDSDWYMLVSQSGETGQSVSKSSDFESAHGADPAHFDDAVPMAYRAQHEDEDEDEDSVHSEADGEVREEICGPGVKISADEVTREYYQDYWGDYGQQLSADFQKVAPPSDRAAMIEEAYLNNQGRPPTTWEKLASAIVLNRMRKVSRMQHQAQAVTGTMSTAIPALLQKAQSDAGMQRALDGLILNLISKSRDYLQRGLGNNAYRELLVPAILHASQSGGKHWDYVRTYLTSMEGYQAQQGSGRGATGQGHSQGQQGQGQGQGQSQASAEKLVYVQRGAYEYRGDPKNPRKLDLDAPVPVAESFSGPIVQRANKLWIVATPKGNRAVSPNDPNVFYGQEPAGWDGNPTQLDQQTATPDTQLSQKTEIPNETPEWVWDPLGAIQRGIGNLWQGIQGKGKDQGQGQGQSQQQPSAITQRQNPDQGEQQDWEQQDTRIPDSQEGFEQQDTRIVGPNDSEQRDTRILDSQEGWAWNRKNLPKRDRQEGWAWDTLPTPEPAGLPSANEEPHWWGPKGARIAMQEGSRVLVPAGTSVTFLERGNEKPIAAPMDMRVTLLTMEPEGAMAMAPGNELGFGTTMLWIPTESVAALKEVEDSGRPARFAVSEEGMYTAMNDRTASAMANVFRGMKLASLRQEYGGDVLATVTWDSEDPTFEGQPSGRIAHWVRTFVKGQSSMKEGAVGDLGDIGRVHVLDLDVDVGMAEVRFQSSRPRVGPGDMSRRGRVAHVDPAVAAAHDWIAPAGNELELLAKMDRSAASRYAEAVAENAIRHDAYDVTAEGVMSLWHQLRS